MPRDDFAARIKEELSKRVRYACSNPTCRRPTIGPNAESTGTISLGVASHITAASEGGPRFDSAITEDQRRDYSNGIWLCQSCSRLIDVDPNNYPVETLLEWRRDAERIAFNELTQQAISLPVVSGSEDSHGQKFNKTRIAAIADIGGFKRALEWSEHAVELNLRVSEEEGGAGQSFKISRLPDGMEVQPEICIVSPPGTGKTTTLIQLADSMLTSERVVPIFVRLSELSAQDATLLSVICRRRPFESAGVNEGCLSDLAEHGQLVLLLDGWNEIDSQLRTWLKNQIKILRRDFVSLRVVVSTRKQALDVPVTGPKVSVDFLTFEQQKEFAQATCGSSGSLLVDRVWQNPDLRELISIPLYFNVLLNGSVDGYLPETKEDLLSLFVKKNEEAADHAEVLRTKVHGCHRAYLNDLAVCAVDLRCTTISEDQAKRAISRTSVDLIREGQLASAIEPNEILDIFVNHHILVRPESGRGLSFQHHQFQEWFASFKVEALMLAAKEGDNEALNELRVNVLNQPEWEEPILFACERASRAGEQEVEAVSNAIKISLYTVDPMLSAEMICRSSHSVWEIVKGGALEYANQWHNVGKVDRAVRFMITTGKGDFSQFVWPMVTNEDSQIRLKALRCARLFKPSVLGTDIESRITSIPEEGREVLLSELASRGGVDGKDLATKLAINDPSPEVQFSVISSLSFYRADSHVTNLLDSAVEEVWPLLAARMHLRDIGSVSHQERMQHELERRLTEEVTPISRLHMLLDSESQQMIQSGVYDLISDENIPFKDADYVLHQAFQKAPKAVASAYASKLRQRGDLPFRAEEVLAHADVEEEGAVVEMVLDPSTENLPSIYAASIVGPTTTKALIDVFLAARKTERVSRRWGHAFVFERRVCATRLTSFVPAILEFSGSTTPDEIADLADLLTGHGDRFSKRDRLNIQEESVPCIVNAIHQWVDAILSSPDGRRVHFKDVACAIGRLGQEELLPDLKRLLDEDLDKLREARNAIRGNRRNTDDSVMNEARTVYSYLYRGAIMGFFSEEAVVLASGYLKNPHFGEEAAFALTEMWKKQQGIPKPDIFVRFPDYSVVRLARIANHSGERQDGSIAALIFSAIEDVVQGEGDEARDLSIKLSKEAFKLPYSNKDELINKLLGLPLPVLSKLGVLQSIVLAGEVMSADVFLAGIDEWLDKVEQNPWMISQENFYELNHCLELLPFSDRPFATIEGIEKVIDKLPQRHRMETVIGNLGHSPNEEALNVLEALARSRIELTHSDAWFRAFLAHAESGGAIMILDLLRDNIPLIEERGWGVRMSAKKLVPLVIASPELRAEIISRYQTDQRNPCTSFIENIFVLLGDDRALAELIHGYVRGGRCFDGMLNEAISNVLLEKREVEGWGDGAYELHPVAGAELRKRLFAMIEGTPHEKSLAISCLNAIDELRDEYGFPEFEPRHPDVISDKPWPIVQSSA